MTRPRALFYGSGVSAGSVAIWIAVGVVTWPRVDSIPSPPPLVVIALSTGVTDSTLANAGAKRLATAVAFARQLGARIITTRVYGPHGESSDIAQRRMIAPAGLADHWTIVPRLVRTTRDEAVALRAVIPDSTPIVLVTRHNARNSAAAQTCSASRA